jgi:molecular chaperone GrpE
MQQDKNNNYDEEFIEEEELDNQQEIEEEEEQTEHIDKEEIIKDLECKIQEKEQRLLRLQADFDNYKKRVLKEKNDIYKYAAEELVNALLPVVDNFERALDSLKGNEESNDGYIQGVEMVFQQFTQVLKKEGVEEIPALGETFDPNVHHAVAQENKKDYEDNTIIDVLQKGYKLKDKVIRPSMVRVCIH